MMHRTGRFTVGSVMTTDVLSVGRSEPLDLAALAMDQRRIRQLVVLEDDGRLAGLVSYRALLRLVASHRADEIAEGGPVSGFMDADPVTVDPGTALRHASQPPPGESAGWRQRRSIEQRCTSSRISPPKSRMRNAVDPPGCGSRVMIALRAGDSP